MHDLPEVLQRIRPMWYVSEQSVIPARNPSLQCPSPHTVERQTSQALPLPPLPPPSFGTAVADPESPRGRVMAMAIKSFFAKCMRVPFVLTDPLGESCNTNHGGVVVYRAVIRRQVLSLHLRAEYPAPIGVSASLSYWLIESRTEVWRLSLHALLVLRREEFRRTTLVAWACRPSPAGMVTGARY